MAGVVRKKQDDKNLQILREIVSQHGNKECFDCSQRGPTYLNMTIGSFVCTRCSGILRGLTPPHRVKSISMATFTTEEIDFIRAHGNDDCAKTWMGLWDPKRTTQQDHRELLIDKYERKRYYLEPASPLKSLQSTQQLTKATSIANSSDNIAALKAITLTPPASLRLFKPNSTHHQQQSVHSQPQQNNNLNPINNFEQQFTPDDSHNGSFNQQQQQQQQQIRPNNNNHFNGLNRNGLNIVSSLSSSQQSTAVTANGKITNGAIAINQSSKNKFTPDSDFVADFGKANIGNATMQNGIATSGFGGSNRNDTFNNNNNNSIKSSSQSSNIVNNSTVNGNGANFADFEHNVIYNAAENQTSINSSQSQWNIWQQYQRPFIQPEQNRWSLPMSLSSTSNNSLHSSGTFNSNLSLNSTPSIDRYAALKDLDEQIREHKEKFDANQTAKVPVTTATVNPFKTNNPFQQQQQQSQFKVTPTPQQQQTTQPPWNSDQLFAVHNGFGGNNFVSNGFGSHQIPASGVSFNPAYSHSHQATNNNVGAIPIHGNPFSAAGSNNPFL